MVVAEGEYDPKSTLKMRAATDITTLLPSCGENDLCGNAAQFRASFNISLRLRGMLAIDAQGAAATAAGPVQCGS